MTGAVAIFQGVTNSAFSLGLYSFHSLNAFFIRAEDIHSYQRCFISLLSAGQAIMHYLLL